MGDLKVQKAWIFLTFQLAYCIISIAWKNHEDPTSLSTKFPTPRQDTVSAPNSYIVAPPLCYKFVTKSINIGKEAAFAPAKDGGLGLIKSRLFCNGLRVGMFKRSLQSDDTWAVALRQAQHGSDPLWLNLSATSLTLNPFSALIGKSFAFFILPTLDKITTFFTPLSLIIVVS